MLSPNHALSKISSGEWVVMVNMKEGNFAASCMVSVRVFKNNNVRYRLLRFEATLLSSRSQNCFTLDLQLLYLIFSRWWICLQKSSLCHRTSYLRRHGGDFSETERLMLWFAWFGLNQNGALIPQSYRKWSMAAWRKARLHRPFSCSAHETWWRRLR